MSNQIEPSPKHGLNPSLNICFWCKEPKGMLLMGYLPNDEKAPYAILTDYEPCDKCKEKFNQGIQLIEISEEHGEGQLPITNRNNKDYYPTGRLIVLDKKSPFIADNNIEEKAAYLDTYVFDILMKQAPE